MKHSELPVEILDVVKRYGTNLHITWQTMGYLVLIPHGYLKERQNID